LRDAVRGVTHGLKSDANYGETTDTFFTSFDSDGFSLNTSDGWMNGSSSTYVAWNWKAGGTAVSNTSGTITSSVSANVDAGFSIVSYTGTGSNATIGHGLSQPPEMYIVKNRSSSTEWPIYVESIGNNYRLGLNSNSGSQSTNTWNYTSPTSTVFTVLGGGHGNLTGDNYISYAFHSVDGHSKVGSYTGNGSTDGPFVHTGFRPAHVIVKLIDTDVHPWVAFNTNDANYNYNTAVLYPNTTGLEESSGASDMDFLSNGFKLRHSTFNGNYNNAGYIYIAFAEMPFKHSNAR
jgi:hypothetical protein